MILLLNFMEAPDCVFVCYLCNEAIHEITLIINAMRSWYLSDVNKCVRLRNRLKLFTCALPCLASHHGENAGEDEISKREKKREREKVVKAIWRALKTFRSACPVQGLVIFVLKKHLPPPAARPPVWISLLFSSLALRDVQFRFILALSQWSAEIKGFFSLCSSSDLELERNGKPIRNIFNHLTICAACKPSNIFPFFFFHERSSVSTQAVMTSWVIHLSPVVAGFQRRLSPIQQTLTAWWQSVSYAKREHFWRDKWKEQEDLTLSNQLWINRWIYLITTQCYFSTASSTTSNTTVMTHMSNAISKTCL